MSLLGNILLIGCALLSSIAPTTTPVDGASATIGKVARPGFECRPAFDRRASAASQHSVLLPTGANDAQLCRTGSQAALCAKFATFAEEEVGAGEQRLRQLSTGCDTSAASKRLCTVAARPEESLSATLIHWHVCLQV